MIILRFGTSGRLAKICEAATRIAYPDVPVISSTRRASFKGHDDNVEWASLRALMEVHPTQQFLVIDASVDHSSIAALDTHEFFKRECISTLHENSRLKAAIGISSGITLIDPEYIDPVATHMLAYLNQKRAQEALFAELDCPVFLPRLFTLIGPITYNRQGAAWAHVLKARRDRAGVYELNEPGAQKAWCSESEVLRRLLTFMNALEPVNDTSALIQGTFTLEMIATSPLLPLPPLKILKGSARGWLRGDYLPSTFQNDEEPFINELIHLLTV